jgi:hypothetical protein
VKYLLLAGIVFGFTAAPAAMIGQWPGMEKRDKPSHRCRVTIAGGLHPSLLGQTLWLGSMLLLAAAGSVAQREDAARS